VSIRRIVAGNWKLNHGPAATADFFRAFDHGARAAGEGEPRVMIFPPALSLAAALEARDPSSGVELGIQNVFSEVEGAYTGENSVDMAAESGATLALVGHSERRHLFHEDDAQVAAKVLAVLGAGLTPVVCVGETLEERRAGALKDVLSRQLGAVLDALAGEPSAADSGAGQAGGEAGAGAGEWILAYEPVWAIGTGETATPADASEAHGLLRSQLRAHPAGRGGSIPILYGGSVKPGNAAELMNAPDVDGVLVGGASLSPESFADIVAAARR
jgi:triosephosphate isomerase